MRCCGTCRAVYRSGFDRCPTDGSELLPCDADPVVGTTINGLYFVEECVGEGAMGRVYRAHHLRLLRRQVALKILIGDLAASVAMRMRFTQEAQAASLLSHPNVVAVLDFGKTPQGLLYMAMEYVEGKPLSRIINEEGPLPADRVIRMARGLCLGLSHAHTQGLIHRDFKPDNVLVVQGSEGEIPRIADFGLAIFSDVDRNAARLTTAGTVVGTPLYTAPEQALDRGIDHRADLFALGVTMFEMLAGCPPFDEKSPIQILHNNLAAPRPRIAERAPGVVVPAALELIVRRLMSSDREQRYPSAQAVVLALASLELEQQPVLPVLPMLPAMSHVDCNKTTQSLTMPPLRRRRIAFGAALAGGFALATLALFWRETPEPKVPTPTVASGPADGGKPAGGAGRSDTPPPAAPLAVAATEPAPSASAAPEPDPAPEPVVRKPARSVRRGSGSEASGSVEPGPADGASPGQPESTSSLLRAESPQAEASPAQPDPPWDEVTGPTPRRPAGGSAGAAAAVTVPLRPGDVLSPFAPEQPPRSGEPPRARAGTAMPRLRGMGGIRAVIDALAVDGSLADAEVRRGVARVQPRLERCYRAAAGRAGRGSDSGLRVSFIVDENGRAREVQVGAGALPGLSACVLEAISAVRTRVPPDISDVRVTLRVGFTQGDER